MPILNGGRENGGSSRRSNHRGGRSRSHRGQPEVSATCSSKVTAPLMFSQADSRLNDALPSPMPSSTPTGVGPNAAAYVSELAHEPEMEASPQLEQIELRRRLYERGPAGAAAADSDVEARAKAKQAQLEKQRAKQVLSPHQCYSNSLANTINPRVRFLACLRPRFSKRRSASVSVPTRALAIKRHVRTPIRTHC